MARHPAPAVSAALAGVRSLTLALAAAATLAVVVGCAATNPEPGPTPTGTSASPAPTVGASADPTPAAPTLAPDGTAQDNLPYFTAVTASVWATESRVAGRAYIDALVAAGFDKSAMQVTNDDTTVGNPAESIQFSVRWGDECLVGQVGPATGDPVTVVLPVVAEGTCLIGRTRPIDW